MPSIITAQPYRISTLYRQLKSLSRAVLPIAVCAASVGLAHADTGTLDYQDVFDLETAAKPVFSPDSKYVVYERVSMDVQHDKKSLELWKIELSSGKNVPLIQGLGLGLSKAASPRNAVFSPSGEKVAFIANDEQGAQIFVYYLDSKDLIQVTRLGQSPSNIIWSPDGKQIAFSMFTPEDTKPIFKDMPSKPEGAKWAEHAKLIDKTLYRRDGSGYVENGYQHLYVVPASGGTPKKITSGSFHHSGTLAWHPKKPLIFFAANRSDNWELEPAESDIFSIDIDTLDLQKVTEFTGPESNPMLSKEGDTLIFEWVNDRKLSYQVNQIMTLDLTDTKTKRSLTPDLDRQIQDVKLKPDSNEIFFSYIDKGETKLASVNIKGKKETYDVEMGGQAIGRPYTSGDFAIAENGTIVFVEDNSHRPGDLSLLKRGKKTQLTDLNSDVFAHINTAIIKPLSVKSSLDELEIGAWIAYPPDYDEKADKKYPLIIEIHGGPHASYGDTFSMEIQLMAAKGYAVVWSNPRGSSSYGEDFGNLIHHNYPSNDYQDLMDVIDVAIETGNIDDSNLFITGGSGGGVLTAWSIGKTKRFSAAVVAKPVINWLSFALTADAYPFFTQYWMEAMPWEIHDKLWQRSPLSLVGNVTTPTMLLTGDADYRTPISETEQYYHALRLQSVPSVMVRIPGASHGIAARPSHLIQKVGNIVAWFDRYNTQKAKEQ